MYACKCTSMHYWNCNFPMTPKSVGRSVGWSVCHKLIKRRKVTHAPFRMIYVYKIVILIICKSTIFFSFHQFKTAIIKLL